MRQLFTWRFVAAVAALAGLVFLINAVVVDDQSLDAVVDPEPTARDVQEMQMHQSCQSRKCIKRVRAENKNKKN